MRVLLDSCMASSAAAELAEVGHQVDCVADWDRDPGDEDILARALRDGQVIITLDKDFGELAVVHGRPHAGLVRLVGFRAGEQGGAAAAVLARYASELSDGALVTADPNRTRVRPRSS